MATAFRVSSPDTVVGVDIFHLPLPVLARVSLGMKRGQVFKVCLVFVCAWVSLLDLQPNADRDCDSQVSGNGQSCGDLLSGQEETVPLETSQESTHVKAEPCCERASPEDRTPGTPGSKDKAPFLPGGGKTSAAFLGRHPGEG